jgi:hypothetical protein
MQATGPGSITVQFNFIGRHLKFADVGGAAGTTEVRVRFVGG